MIPRTRDALSQLLARTFPHTRDINPETLDAFVDGLMRTRTSRGASALTSSGASLDPDAHRVLRLRATHARRTPVTSVFTGVTHAVWVSLPQDQPSTIETALGDVLPGDHLLPTVAAVRERFGARLGRTFERVDLLTPPRQAAVRFSPMSLYFGYLGADDCAPSFVIYEPGDAVGNPGALYLGESLDTAVEERAGYKPTPLSSPDHWYTGGIRMAENGCDPSVLYMSASVERGGEPHFRLHVDYSPVDESPTHILAGDLVEAALRMLAVLKGVGDDQNLVERMVAETGLLALDWVDRPDNRGEPPPRIENRPFVACTAFDEFIGTLSTDDRELFESSIALLLGAVVRSDGKFDRLERVELDWRLNFEVPRELGDAFRFTPAAEREIRALFDGDRSATRRSFDARLRQLGEIVRRLPAPLRERYGKFVTHACRDAAESSGDWLWFGTKVGEEEKRVLDRIAAVLEL
jgi:hypothetical protein